MVEALQILLILVLIALVTMIVGYLVGKLSCKRVQNDYYFQKNETCESKYSENIANIEKRLNDIDSSKEDSNIEIKEKELLDSNNSNETETKITVIHSNDEGKNSNQDVELKKKFKNIDLLEKDNINIDNTSSASNSKSSKDLDIIKNDTEIKSQNEDVSNLSFLLAPLEDKEPDNLSKIKGIGKVIENKLNNMGVYYFEQIAKWSEKDVKYIDNHLAFKGRIYREDWINQAKILASGKDTEFSKRFKQKERKG